MKLPNLIVAGAQKSGTTWLYAALREHSDIFMSDSKELNFFNRLANYNNEEALDTYLENFDFTGGHKYVGEATPHYMWIRQNFKPYDPSADPRTAAEFIKRVTPDAKIIMVLRNPVTRAVSAFHHHFALGRLTGDSKIDEANEKLGILDIGHYERHVSYWREIFGDNLLVYLYDDLKSDGTQFLSSIFTDLGVEDTSNAIGPVLAARKINAKQKILSRNEEKKSEKFPLVTNNQIGAMVNLFESDISFIESILGRNLSEWRDIDQIEQSLVYS